VRSTSDRCQEVKDSGYDISALEGCTWHRTEKLNVLSHESDGSGSVETLDRVLEVSGRFSHDVSIDHVRIPQIIIGADQFALS
jgi:hypothetical protein